MGGRTHYDTRSTTAKAVANQIYQVNYVRRLSDSGIVKRRKKQAEAQKKRYSRRQFESRIQGDDLQSKFQVLEGRYIIKLRIGGERGSGVEDEVDNTRHRIIVLRIRDDQILDGRHGLGDDLGDHGNGVNRRLDDDFVGLQSPNTDTEAQKRNAPLKLQQLEIPADSSHCGIIKLRLPASIPERLSIGRMEYNCQYCQAPKFKFERNVYFCCDKKPHLAKWRVQQPSDEYVENIKKISHTSIRQYNSAFAFTSTSVKYDEKLLQKLNGSYTFRVHGRLFHMLGPLEPANGKTPAFAQCHMIYDPELRVESRCQYMQELDRDMIVFFDRYLQQHNQHIHDFRRILEVFEIFNTPIVEINLLYHGPTSAKADSRPGQPVVRINLEIPHQTNPKSSKRFESIDVNTENDQPNYGNRTKALKKHSRKFCLPTVQQVALLYPRGIDELDRNRTHSLFVLHRVAQTSKFETQFVPRMYPGADPLHFVLMFPHGDYGWIDDAKLTPMQYYGFMATYRHEHCHLFLCGRLFHEYLVTAYLTVEEQRLDWNRFHQKTIRAELYSGLSDHVHHSDSTKPGLENCGRIILPGTFIGSPRNKYRLCQDAMALVREFGKPTYFVTMTMNPHDPDIVAELMDGQDVSDRPDLTTRVFRGRLHAFKEYLHPGHSKTKLGESPFGQVVAWVYSVEFQKRGLPHAHFVLWVAESDNPRTPDAIDRVISGELPDADDDGFTRELVERHMMHRCDSNYCSKDGSCAYHYPQPLCDTTSTNDCGYTFYKRSSSERKNAFVVPYNRELLRRFQCHINVELCNTVTPVRYLFKYISKNADEIQFSILTSNNSTSSSNPISPLNDEIDKYVESRYISADESMWRLMHAPLHEISPPVTLLAIHLPGEHHVLFTENDTPESIQKKSKTTLTEYFTLCQREEEARQYTYNQIPHHYTWLQNKHMWQKRKTGAYAVGRLATAALRDRERFYMRILLHNVCGPRSFEDLRTVDGVVYDSFESACIALHLADNDCEWELAMTEAAQTVSASELRDLFVSIIQECDPTHAQGLWEKFKTDLCDDIWRKWANEQGIDIRQVSLEICPVEVESLAMNEINKSLEVMGKSLHDVPGFESYQSSPVFLSALDAICPAVAQERFDTAFRQLNDQQRFALTQIQTAIDNSLTKQFFIDGPAGTGKTFLYNTMIDYCDSKGLSVAAVATSAVAALLIRNGHTAHSTFKLPIVKTCDKPTCNISKQSALAQFLRDVRLIVWDEISMANRWLIEALDISLRDITGCSAPFGGKIIVFGGDFRQLLPVVLGADRPKIVDASLKMSYVWPSIVKLHLSENMRLKKTTQTEYREFVDFLLRVGNGTEPELNGRIKIPRYLISESHTLHDFVLEFYAELPPATSRIVYFQSRMIITALNHDVKEINEMMLQKFQGETRLYLSHDSVDYNQYHHFPPDFLNRLPLGSTAPHELKLKIGVPIMLLRNLNVRKGLCNGTRLIITGLQDHIIHAIVITGPGQGQYVSIPRIDFDIEHVGLPCKIRRRQFPVVLAFAMTIHKAQGQSLDKVGIYLNQDLFAHGHLYVALSRAKYHDQLKIFCSDSQMFINDDVYVKNVVYHEVLS